MLCSIQSIHSLTAYHQIQFHYNMSYSKSKHWSLVKQEGRIERWAWSMRRRERSYVVLGEAAQLTDTGPPCSPPAVPGILGHSPLCYSGSEPVSVCFIISRSLTGRQTLPAQLPSTGQWRIIMNISFWTLWLSPLRSVTRTSLLSLNSLMRL